MEDKGLKTPIYKYYPQAYNLPVKNDKQSAVNVYINATPQQPYAAACPYPYYIPYYIPYQQQAKTENTNVPATTISKPLAAKQEEKNKTEEKPLTPLTPELLTGLKNDLTKGDKETRKHAVTRVVNLLNEDRVNRSKDPAVIALLDTARHENQPKIVRETANLAAEDIKYEVPKAKRLDVYAE